MPSRLAIRPEVFINGEYDPTAHVNSCERWAGGRRLDTATIVLDIARRGQHVVDRQAGENTDMVCTVVASINGESRILHWGHIDIDTLTIGDEGETITLVSRVDRKHFGEPLFGQRQFNIRRGGFTDVAKPMVFNPEVDGRIRFNRRPPDYAAVSTFVDEGSALTESAWSLQLLPDGPQPWTLATAVIYLCWHANGGQRYIQNPLLDELVSVMQETADNPLRNVRLPNGHYLPEMLDQLLEPFGFTWCIDYVGEDSRKIRVIRMGRGEPVYLELQRPGESHNGRPQVKRVDVPYSQGERVNEVEAFGSRKVVEATFELVPAWSPSEDSHDIFDLAKDDPEWINRTAVHRVWRDWVLNEAGDYSHLRNSNDVPDLSILLIAGDGEVIDADGWSVPPMRLEFLPTLTLGQDGKPAGRNDGVFVEYYEPHVNKWLPFNHEEDPSHVVRVLRNECGIRFDGAVPPYELQAIAYTNEDGSRSESMVFTPRIRVTASIELPIATRTVALNQSIRPTTRLVLPLDGDYHHRYLYLSGSSGGRIQSSEFATRVFAGAFLPAIITPPNGQYITSTRDDTEKMAAIAQSIRAAWDMAEVSGTMMIEGLELLSEVDLGKMVAAITGRNLTFYADSAATKGPQIFGISVIPQQQQIVITLNVPHGVDDFLGSALSSGSNQSLRRAM